MQIAGIASGLTYTSNGSTAVSTNNQYVPAGAELVLTGTAGTTTFTQISMGDEVLATSAKINTAVTANYTVDLADADNGVITFAKADVYEVMVDGKSYGYVNSTGTPSIDVDHTMVGEKLVYVTDTASWAFDDGDDGNIVTVQEDFDGSKNVGKITVDASKDNNQGQIVLEPAVAISLGTKAYNGGTIKVNSVVYADGTSITPLSGWTDTAALYVAEGSTLQFTSTATPSTAPAVGDMFTITVNGTVTEGTAAAAAGTAVTITYTANADAVLEYVPA